ncbi:MAG: DUF5719 family protein, partial [Actinomycetota bacterium]|nr:DUF5719 family protein [Actinomycetota bacterium]
GAEKDVSIALRSDGGLCAERIMYFKTPFDILGGYPGGVHNSTGIESAGTQYYFAEGTTRSNFQEWLCLFNPQGREAPCSVRYATETGGVIKEETVSIPPASRLTLDVKKAVGEGKDVSIFVESELPIAAERPIYFQYAPTCFSSPSLLDGGHNVSGIKYAAYRWDFAEGTTRDGFETYLCLANPANRPANLSIKYITSEGGTSSVVSKTMKLEAGFRKTIRVNDVVGSGKDVSVIVTSEDVPVIAERPIYFNHQGSMGGGCSPGLPGAR